MLHLIIKCSAEFFLYRIENDSNNYQVFCRLPANSYVLQSSLTNLKSDLFSPNSRTLSNHYRYFINVYKMAHKIAQSNKATT